MPKYDLQNVNDAGGKMAEAQQQCVTAMLSCAVPVFAKKKVTFETRLNAFKRVKTRLNALKRV